MLTQTSQRPGILLQILLLVGLSLLPIEQGYAEEDSENEKQPAVSQETFDRLNQARKAMDKSSYGEAVATLTALLPKVKDNAYETALAQQSLAYAYLAQQRYPQAIDSLGAALQENKLGKNASHHLRYNLAQVYIQTEQFERGLQVLDRWFAEEKNPSADAHILAAMAHQRLKHLEAAQAQVEKALKKADQPHEDWQQLLLSIYFERKHYQEAIPLLHQFIAQHPAKAEYWHYLTDAHLLLKHEDEAIATLREAQAMGITSEQDRIRLAQLYLHQHIPYSAAHLLEQGLAGGAISRTAAHLQLLGNSWALAREHKRAIVALQQAADLGRDGDLYLQVAQMQIAIEQWNDATQSLERAIQQGGLKDPEQAHLLLGYACYHQGNKHRASLALQHASKNPKLRTQAQRLLEQIQRESERKNEGEQS